MPTSLLSKDKCVGSFLPREKGYGSGKLGMLKIQFLCELARTCLSHMTSSRSPLAAVAADYYRIPAVWNFNRVELTGAVLISPGTR